MGNELVGVSVKKGWTKNSKLALVGLVGSIIVIIITLTLWLDHWLSMKIN